MVIIEYEAPNCFISPRAVNHAYNQIISYMILEAESSNDRASLVSKLAGVGFDGNQIFFVRYKNKSISSLEIDKSNFVISGPYRFTTDTAQTLLTYFRSLDRIPLSAETLALKFGPKSENAKTSVCAFINALENFRNARVDVFFNEWKRLFGIVYGNYATGKDEIEANKLKKMYGLESNCNYQKLLFAIHTYFALLMKLIAVELVTYEDNPFSKSFTFDFIHLSRNSLKDKLNEIEEGRIFLSRGITNFLEGDFFQWYLDAFAPCIEDAIKQILRELSNFEFVTGAIRPEETRDLLKKLYQYLIPKQIRHKLGEYYTPEWLAKLIIDETGYFGDANHRFLDPACGSGTFLVEAIQRVKQACQSSSHLTPGELGKIITQIFGDLI